MRKDGKPQLVYYSVGVNGFLGGTFGQGLDENIRLAYCSLQPEARLNGFITACHSSCMRESHSDCSAVRFNTMSMLQK